MNDEDRRLEASLGVLSTLTLHEPDSARAGAVLARCHALMGQRRSRERRRAHPRPFVPWLSAARRGLEPALVGCLCAMFLVEVLSRAVRLYTF